MRLWHIAMTILQGAFGQSISRQPPIATNVGSADRQFNRASPILVEWVGRVKREISAAMACSARLSS